MCIPTQCYPMPLIEVQSLRPKLGQVLLNIWKRHCSTISCPSLLVRSLLGSNYLYTQIVILLIFAPPPTPPWPALLLLQLRL